MIPTSRYFNLNQLVSVKVEDFEENTWYKVRTELHFLGFKIREGGVVWFGDITTLPANSVIRDGKVYYKPCVTCKFSNGQRMVNFFENYEVAKTIAAHYMDSARIQLFTKEID